MLTKIAAGFLTRTYCHYKFPPATSQHIYLCTRSSHTHYNTNTSANRHTHTKAHKSEDTLHTHNVTHTTPHTHPHTHSPECIHIHSDPLPPSQVASNTHTHTPTHAHAHTHTPTHTHTHTLAQTHTSDTLCAEVQILPRMSGREIRRMCESAAHMCVRDVSLWTAVCVQCVNRGSTFKFFDCIGILKCMQRVCVYDKSVFVAFSHKLSENTSRMHIHHICDILDAYRFAELQPKKLFLEVFHAIHKLTHTMYAQEACELVCCLSRNCIYEKQLLASIYAAIAQFTGTLNYAHICRIVGAVNALSENCETNMSDTAGASLYTHTHTQTDVYFLLDVLDTKAQLEIEMMTVQELVDTVIALPSLDYTWAHYEQKLHDALINVTKAFEGSEDMDQLAEPFEVLDFMQRKNILHKAFLLCLCVWCQKAVYRPPTRTHKRPLAFQLVKLHDIMREWGIEDNKELKDAIRYFVHTKGANDTPNDPYKPLDFTPTRQYVQTPDPLQQMFQPEMKLDNAYVLRQRKPTIEIKDKDQSISLNPLKKLRRKQKPKNAHVSVFYENN